MTFGGAKSDVLQEVDVRIISPQQCANSYNKWISDSQICTYTEGKDACQVSGRIFSYREIVHRLTSVISH